jgi:hypothetical protein
MEKRQKILVGITIISAEMQTLRKNKLLVEANALWADFLEFCLLCPNIIPITLLYLKLRFLHFHSTSAFLT